jgi:predicted metal-dependent hydrolase
MSSATTYEWGYAEKNLKQILRENKEFLKGEMNESIRDIMKIISRHKDKFKHINELVEILEKFRDDFLSSYTLDILRSPMHTQWVDDKMNNFNALLFNVKAFIKLLELEIGEKAYIKALKGIADKIPKECKNLKEEIEKYIEIEKEIEKAKEHMDLESLKRIYYELPAFAKDKEEISNILLREELIKKKKNQEIASGKQTKIDEKDEIENIKKEAKEYYEKLKKISETEAERLKFLYEELLKSDDKFRINLILEEIKYAYARKKKQFVKSETLKEMISKYLSEDLPQSLKEEINAFLEKEIVSEEEYKDLNSRITRHLIEKKERKSISKEDIDQLSRFLSESLRRLGYQIVNDEAIERLKKGEVVEINTPFGEDYVVRIRLDEKGILALKFVRYVEDENNLSMYEKEKDKAIAKQWCNNQKEIIEFLRNNGIALELKNIMEPEDRFYYEKKEKRKLIEGQTREKDKKTFKRSL